MGAKDAVFIMPLCKNCGERFFLKPEDVAKDTYRCSECETDMDLFEAGKLLRAARKEESPYPMSKAEKYYGGPWWTNVIQIIGLPFILIFVILQCVAFVCLIIFSIFAGLVSFVTGHRR